MGLDEEERKSVVVYRLKRAKETFAEVPFHIEHKFYKTAANRLYYACFYAATALLINDRYEAHTHGGVKILLGLHYINNNKIANSLGKMYRQLFNLRQTGDYEDWTDIDEDDIIPFVKPAEQFIATIENLIAENG